MPQEITSNHTESGTVERDADGELIPEEHTVILPDGDEVIVKTKPITTGLLNELSQLDEAIAQLEPEAVHEAFQTIYVSEALCNMTVAEIRDTRAEYLTAYLEPLDNAVEENIGDADPNR